MHGAGKVGLCLCPGLTVRGKRAVSELAVSIPVHFPVNTLIIPCGEVCFLPSSCFLRY